jgi:hypothetical protein
MDASSGCAPTSDHDTHAAWIGAYRDDARQGCSVAPKSKESKVSLQLCNTRASAPVTARRTHLG